MRGYITDEYADIEPWYLDEVKTEIRKLVDILVTYEPSQAPIVDASIESTIYKALVYMNRLELPKPLHFVTAELVARQLPDYFGGLKNDKPQGVVKKVQRGGFMEEYETKGSEANTPRGTLFTSDYIKYLNKYRRLRTI